MPQTRTRTYRGTPRNLALLANKLRAGELVAVPTETVYGLAAHALDARACRRVFQAKGRPTTDPLIIHVHDRSQVEALAWPGTLAHRLMKAFWPGPLTLVLDKRDVVPAIVTAGLDSVAVRMSAHPLFRRLLKRCGLPLAAPSANPFGYVSPTRAEHVKASLDGRVAHILDGGPCQVGLESTIVDLRRDHPVQILRPGIITANDISQILGMPVTLKKASAGFSSQAQASPGLMSSHYSPRARVILHSKITPGTAGLASATEAVLYFAKPSQSPGPHCHWLAERKSDGKQAAQNLFARLRELDRAGYLQIHVERAPQGPLADAINDRLTRAATQ